MNRARRQVAKTTQTTQRSTAQSEVDKATRGVSDAQNHLSAAQKNLEAEQQKAAQHAETMKQAQQTEQAAQDAQAKADQNVRTAKSELDKAQTALKAAQARLDAENKAKADAAAKKNEQQLGGSQQTALKPTEQAILNAAKTFDASTGSLASTGTETTALLFTSITLATLGLAAWGPSRRKAAKPRHAA